MGNQYSTPCLVSGEVSANSHQLSRVPFESGGKDGFDEGWLQSVIQTNPEIIPVDQIEPVFSPLIPLCREASSRAGRADNFFINPQGMLTVIECKLFKNPQARREVVAQIMDYAKEITSWTYEKLESVIKSARNDKSVSLLDIVRGSSKEPVEEAAFIDAVNNNLKRGRLLLIVAGDGIRSDAEDLVRFLDRHAHLNFTLSIVEFAVFRLPDNYPHKYLVTPRVLVKTKEHVRATIRINSAAFYEVEPPEETASRISRGGGGARGISIGLTEQVLLEKLNAKTPNLGDDLIEFAEELRQHGLTVDCTKQSLNIYYSEERGNLGMCNVEGKVEFQRANDRPEYLADIAAIIPGAVIRESNPRRVQVDGDHPDLVELLKNKREWLRAILAEVGRVQSRS